MRKFFYTHLIAIISFPAFAQQKAANAFSLKEAVDYAIQNNSKAKNAVLDEQKAKAFNWEILTTGLPQANITGEYDYYFKTPIVPAFDQYFSTFSNIGTQIDKLNGVNGAQFPNLSNLSNLSSVSFVLPNDITTNLSINQLLLDGRYFIGLKARKELYKSSRLSRGMTEQEIRYAVIKAYFQAEGAQESKSLLQDNLKILDKILSDTRATFEQGLIEELDVNRLELAEATLQSQINMQNQLSDVGLANLKFQMGLPLDQDIVLTQKLDELKAEATLADEKKFDPKNRVEYDLLSTAVTLKGYDAAQKRSGYFPTLSAFLNYGWNTQTQEFGDMFKGVNWYQQGYVGLRLNVPIFDAGQKGAQVKQAKLEQLKAANDFENFKNAAQLQYQSAQSGFNSALADEVLSQKTLNLSKKIYDTNEEKFKDGAGSSFELQQSEQDYTTNQLKHIQSVMNLLNAKADLDKAMGVQ